MTMTQDDFVMSVQSFVGLIAGKLTALSQALANGDDAKTVAVDLLATAEDVRAEFADLMKCCKNPSRVGITRGRRKPAGDVAGDVAGDTSPPAKTRKGKNGTV